MRIPTFALAACWWTRETGGRAAPGAPAPVQFRDALPLALVRGGRVVEATPAARVGGLWVGAPVPQAGGEDVASETVHWDQAAVDAEVVRGTALFLTVSTHVTPVAGAPGMWWVAAAGGGSAPGGERGMARALLRLARRWHPRPRLGVASSCVAARAAAWGDTPASGGELIADAEGCACVVPRGGCAAFIAGAPIGFVPMDPPLRRALLAGGVRTVGALAALAPGEVQRQWGCAGMAAWRLARGDDPRRPVLSQTERSRAVVAELAVPTTQAGSVLALVRAALERLVGALAAEDRAAAAVALTLTLDDGRGAHPAGGLARTVTRELRLPCPLNTAAPILSRWHTLLARWPLPAPVCGVRVEITATGPRAPASLSSELLRSYF